MLSDWLNQIQNLVNDQNATVIMAYATVLSSLAALLSVVVLIIGLILPLLFNYFLLKRRSEDDRSYQNKYDFYQKLIIDNVGNFIKLSADFGVLIDELYEESNSQKLIVMLDICSSRIDGRYNEFERIILPIVRCYSNNFYKDFSKEIERLYDKAYFIAYKIAGSDEEKKSLLHFQSEYQVYKEEYLSSIFSLLALHKPDPKAKK